MKNGLLAVCLLLSLAQLPHAQDQRVVDSLLRVLNSTVPDTVKCKVLAEISFRYKQYNLDSALKYSQLQKQLGEAIGWKRAIAVANSEMGLIMHSKGDLDAALEFHHQALKISKEIDYKRVIAGSYHNIGMVYNALSNYPDAIRYYEMAKEINEDTGNKQWLMNNYFGLSYCYLDLGNYAEAVRYSYSYLRIAEEMGQKKLVAHAYTTLGWIYYKYLGEYQEAMDKCSQAMKIYVEIGEVRESTHLYNVMGNILLSLGRPIEANDKFLAGLKIAKEYDDRVQIPVLLGNLANGYNNQGNQAEAIRCHYESMEYGDMRDIANAHLNIGAAYGLTNMWDSARYHTIRALEMASGLNALQITKVALGNLAEIDSALGDYRSALEHYKQYIVIRDSLFNAENTKKILQQQMQYEFEKKERDLKCQMEVSEAEAREAQEKYEQQLLLAKTQQQELELKQAALALSDREVQMHEMAFQQKQSELEVADLQRRDKQKALDISLKENALQELKLSNRSQQRNILGVAMLLSLVSIYLVFRNYNNQRRANSKLQLLNVEVGEMNQQLNVSNSELSDTLEDLKQTQAQLVATEKAKETEVIRRRISQDIHDDISSGLTRIAWLSETARELAGKHSKQEVNATLDRIVDSSRETIERLGEIVWAINPDKDNLEGFFAYLRTYITHYLEGRDYKVQIDFPEEKLDVRFNPDLKRTLFLVVKEALHNVVKHAGAKNIDISFRVIGQQYELVLADDGRGFDPASVKSHSNGLRNMRERIEATGGRFDVVTGKALGTKILLQGEIFA